MWIGTNDQLESQWGHDWRKSLDVSVRPPEEQGRLESRYLTCNGYDLVVVEGRRVFWNIDRVNTEGVLVTWNEVRQ